MLQDANQKAGDDIDRRDEDGRHRIPLRETRGPVHGAIEFRLARQHLAPGARFVLIDQSGIQVRIHRHLLARHGVQSEARRDFRNADRAVIDHHVLDGDQHQEDHYADDVVAAHHESSERLDHFSRGRGSRISVQQDQARRRNIQGQAEQRHQQQRGRKDAELHRFRDVERDQQYDHRQRDIGADQDVQQKRRQRRDHRHHDPQHADRHDELAPVREQAGPRRWRLRTRP